MSEGTHPLRTRSTPREAAVKFCDVKAQRFHPQKSPKISFKTQSIGGSGRHTSSATELFGF